MTPEKNDANGVDLSKPATRRRMEFLDFRLFWYGRFSRKEFADAFGRSPQQASLDIGEYLDAAPDNATYDAGTKSYLRLDSFKPIVMNETVDRYLMQLLGLETKLIEPEVTFFDELPSTEIVGLKRKPLHYLVVQKVVEAVRECKEIQIDYSSINSGTSSRRWIAPHTLFFSAGRWYIRAWVREKNDFRDFSLGRISGIFESRPCLSVKDDDYEWKLTVDLQLSANPNLIPEQRIAVEHEYDMLNGFMIKTVRLKTAFYIINEHNLDLNPEQIPAHKQQLILHNLKDVLSKLELAREMSKDALRKRFPDIAST